MLVPCEAEPERPAHVDVAMRDRGNVSELVIGESILRRLAYGADAGGVPSHDNVRQQRECRENGR